MLYIVFFSPWACLFGHYVIGMEAVSFRDGHKKCPLSGGLGCCGHENPARGTGF